MIELPLSSAELVLISIFLSVITKMILFRILDNLPLVVPVCRMDQESSFLYQHVYLVGLKGIYAGSKDEKYFINNHLAFTVKYHKDLQTDSARIVGFEVKPFSVKHEYEGTWNDKTRLTTCDPHAKRTFTNSESPQEVADKKEIIFTYDVEFEMIKFIGFPSSVL